MMRMIFTNAYIYIMYTYMYIYVYYIIIYNMYYRNVYLPEINTHGGSSQLASGLVRLTYSWIKPTYFPC